MKYIGSKIIEITEKPKDFTPHRMLCWESSPNHALEEYVIAIVKRSDDILFITDHSVWTHGAEIPEEPKSRTATHAELAKWVAQGNGQVTHADYKDDTCMIHFSHPAYATDSPVCAKLRVRKWGDAEWHEPTADYMDLPEDK